MVNTSKTMYDPTSSPCVHKDPRRNHSRGYRNAAGQSAIGQCDLYYVTSTVANSGWLADAVSAAYGLSEVYDYDLDRHQRNSINGKGGTILGLVRYGTGYSNAILDRRRP